ncbi:transporter [Allorhizocola rhizosphaerae]|uniref:transporter n=1 Tax=Allorhizocola rhizosphaerae TaxID=1872709 RepID=UPI000E3EB8D7|nr:transporter [Allorhizocola rhizosphaerae]
MTPIDEDPPPPSPAESLRMIAEQREAAERQLSPDPLVYHGPWGVAWLVGFGVMFLRHGPGGTVLVAMPAWLPLAVLFTLLIGAAIVSGVLAGRTSRHVRGRSSVQGAMYGFSWFVSFAGMGLTLQRFDDGLSPPNVGLLWATVAVGLTGALHMAGGAVWQDRLLFGLGVWLTLVNVVGTALGPGWHSLVISLAGGAVMLLLGLVLRRRPAGRPNE